MQTHTHNRKRRLDDPSGLVRPSALRSSRFGATSRAILAALPPVKLFALAAVLGLLSSGMFVMLVPQEVGGDGDGNGGEELTISPDRPAYHPGDTVNIFGNYTGDPCNITFQVKDPNNETHLIESMPTATGQGAGAAQDEDLVGYWPFDEGSGQVIHDLSKNGFDGCFGESSETEIKDPIWVGGISGAAAQFDGEHNYCMIRNDTDNYFGLKNAFSVTAWVYIADETVSTQMHVFDGESSASAVADRNAGFSMFIDDTGELKGRVGTGVSGTSKISTVSDSVVPTQQWVFLSYTREGASGRLYINGEFDGSNDELSSGDINWNGHAYEHDCYEIGRHWQNGELSFFNGTIDEVAVYSRALNSSEIAALYHEHSLKLNLTAHWTFDENIGDVAYDETDNHNDGTIYGATWTNGIDGAALEFDGNNDHALSSSFSGSPEFTYSVWVKINGPTQFHRRGMEMNVLFHKQKDVTATDGRCNAGLLFYGYEYPEHLDFVVYGESSGHDRILYDRNFTDDNFHHLVATASKDSIALYVDGLEVERKSIDIGDISTKNFPLYIGNADSAGSPSGMDSPMNGIIDDPRVYSRVLSTDEITTLYHQNSWKTNLSGHWTLDEGTGQTAYDESGNGHNGTLGNSSSVDEHDPVWTEGISGKALKFDGVDDYVDTGIEYTYLSGADALTISAWINLANYSEEAMAFVANAYSSSSQFSFGIVQTTMPSHARQLHFGFCSDGSWQGNYFDKYILALHHWYLVTVTVTDNILKWYVNGTLEETDVVSFSTLGEESSSVPTIKFGWDNQKYQTFYEGLLDDPRIYNRALNSSEIAALYHSYTAKSEYQTATLSFQLPEDAPLGTWTVYATNDVDDATATITFEVIPLPGPETITIKYIVMPSTINRGEILVVDLTIESTFETDQHVTLVLQLKDQNKRALRPAIEEKTVAGRSTPVYQLSVAVPSSAIEGYYFVQIQILTGLPENGGYVLDFETTNIQVL